MTSLLLPIPLPTFTPLTIVPSSGRPIRLGAASHLCRTCGYRIYPIPMTSASQGWITNPCHEHECPSCYEHPSDDRFCSYCETCPACCNCHECNTCSRNLSSTGDAYCSACRRRKGRNEYRGDGVVPGWQERGEHADSSVCSESYEEWQTFRSQVRHVDPVGAMASFYLLDYIGAFRFDDTMVNVIADEARAERDAIVAELDPLFRTYAAGAIMGELRHHPQVISASSHSRTTASSYGLAQAKVSGAANFAADAVKLFSDDEAWENGFGGTPWANCAEVWRLREANLISPFTFVDRVFSLQHNGGSFLNKVTWEKSPHDCMAVGEAHSAVETDLAVLQTHAGAQARRIFADWWKARNRALRDLGRPMLTMPTRPTPHVYVGHADMADVFVKIALGRSA